MKAMKPAFETELFKEDVQKFSLLGGSEFLGLCEQLGDGRVVLLWKAMAPNPALRMSFPEFMCAFFKQDYMTVLGKPDEQLRVWDDKNVGCDNEVIPLFLNESHGKYALETRKTSCVVKSAIGVIWIE
jgi:hypothetical protein